MGHTNETSNYDLPQFIGTDKPTWLGDINGAFLAIDNAIAGVASDATSAVSIANGAATLATSASEAASAATTTAEAASTAATSAASVANTAADTANNAQSTAVLAKSTADTASATATATDTKVGALTDLHTTVKTSIVAAINEIEGEVNRGSVSVTADGVKTYGEMLDLLAAEIDDAKVTENALLVVGEYRAPIARNTTSRYEFGVLALHNANAVNLNVIRIEKAASGSAWYRLRVATDGTTADHSTTNVPADGTVFKLLY